MKTPRIGLTHLDAFLAIHIFLSLVMTLGLCIGIVLDARTEFSNTREDAMSSAKSAAELLTVEIRERRALAGLMVGQNRRFLEEILDSSEPDSYLIDMANLMEIWFPASLAFTLGNVAGSPVITDFKGSIGSVCLEDMRRSIANNAQIVPLHGMSSIPHYDLTIPVGDKGVFLVTFTTRNLKDFLERAPDAQGNRTM